MVRSNAASWNVRNRHMAETLDRLLQHHGPRSRGIVLAHNTPMDDTRHTDMAEAGEVNIGQLARESLGARQVVLVGFSTHRGTVVAGREWDAPMQVMRIPIARPSSWDDVLHDVSAEDKLLIFDPARLPREALRVLSNDVNSAAPRWRTARSA
jgi:erythromycin esterase-like protein